MKAFYELGVFMGVWIAYSIATWGLGYLFGGIDEYDDFKKAFMAWLFGAFAFLALFVFTMTKFELWW